MHHTYVFSSFARRRWAVLHCDRREDWSCFTSIGRVEHALKGWLFIAWSILYLLYLNNKDIGIFESSVILILQENMCERFRSPSASWRQCTYFKYPPRLNRSCLKTFSYIERIIQWLNRYQYVRNYFSVKMWVTLFTEHKFDKELRKALRICFKFRVNTCIRDIFFWSSVIS